jgi:hypothetical protein
VDHAHNLYISPDDAVYDDVVVNRKAPPASPQIVVARPSRSRMIGKQIKPVRYGVDLTIGDRQPG